MSDNNLMSPLRLQTYRNDENNTQTFQWVVSEYAANQLAKWKSVINGSEVVVQEVTVVDLIAEMFFTVTANPSAANAVLVTTNPPSILVNNVESGACTYGGDITTYNVTQELYNTNSLIIYKNGVKQQKGSDVTFVSTNHLQFAARLQVGDIIVIDHVQGV